MQQGDMASLQSFLETLPTEQLDEMLDKELHSEVVDDRAVQMILNVLWEREKDIPVVVTPGMEKAWKKYQQNMARLQQEAERQERKKKRVWLLRGVSAAAVILVLLLAVVPQRAEAESIWERLARWSDSIFEFVNPNSKKAAQEEYVFQTDNPGLQQVYDAVVELGVTGPVVPMWLPEGYELLECRTFSAPAKNYVHARFSDGSDEITFMFNVYNLDVPHEYDKDATQVDNFERNGTTYNIMRNKEMWVVIWSRDFFEGALVINCQENTLDRILMSIYTLEDD